MDRTPIAARLPPGGDALADHDSTVGSIDHAAVPGRHGARGKPSEETLRKYRRWLRGYQEWCAGQKPRPYQVELQFLTDAKAEEFIASLVVDRDDRPRYPPNTVYQALAALRYWAKRAAVHPMPSFDAAYGVVHAYMDALVRDDVIASRQRRRIRPGDPVG